MAIGQTQESSGNTLLHIAAQNGNKRAAKCLLRRGIDINARNHRGNTAVHYCFAYGYVELGEYLISKGGDDLIKNVDGLSCYEGISIEFLAHL